MKKTRILSVLLALSMMTSAAVGCGNDSSGENGSENTSATEEVSPIDELDDDEAMIYTAVVGTSFYDPASARVLRGFYSNNKWSVVIQAANKVGGNVNSCYYAYGSSLDKWDVDNYDSSLWDAFDTYAEKILSDESIGKINKAISYYWESKGF